MRKQRQVYERSKGESKILKMFIYPGFKVATYSDKNLFIHSMFYSFLQNEIFVSENIHIF